VAKPALDVYLDGELAGTLLRKDNGNLERFGGDVAGAVTLLPSDRPEGEHAAWWQTSSSACASPRRSACGSPRSTEPRPAPACPS
jgi:hypothetical protein